MNGGAPLPWNRTSGCPLPVKSAMAGEESVPSATTGKMCRLTIVMGQCGR